MNMAIVLSGGIGTRMGTQCPKQYIKVAGKMIITYCLDTLMNHPMVDAVWLVIEEEWQKKVLQELDSIGINREKVVGFSKPGATRQLSIFNGLSDVKQYVEFKFPDSSEVKNSSVLIHDAARPCLSEKLITECLLGLEEHDGAMPVLPMKDTVYLSDTGKQVTGLLDRSRIYAGQAPEAFRLEAYYQANIALFPEKIYEINGSTEPAIMAGMDVTMIEGDEANFKITTRKDLEKFEEIVESWHKKERMCK